MPHVINGIGTWYYGKANLHSRQGQCEFCQRYTDLYSYDTTTFFVVVMVPLIPLKKVHVSDECSICKRHRAMPLKKWEEIRDQSLHEALTAYAADPRNGDKAADAIGATTSFRMGDAFLQLLPTVRQNFRGNPDMLRLLGASCSFFGRNEEAEACYRDALAAGDSPEAARALAMVLMRTGRPDQARPLLQPILDTRDGENRGLLFLLIESYQALGRHDQALALCDQIQAAFPGIQGDSEFTRYRHMAQSNLASGKPIASRNLRPPGSQGTAPPASLPILPKLIGPAVIAAILLVYLLISFTMGMRRTVYVINGMGKPYHVVINGHPLFLQPHQIDKSLTLPEGEITVSFPGPELSLAPQKHHFSSSIWTRPFAHRTFVLNPDRTAVIFTQSTHYSTSAGSSTPGRQVLQLYVCDGGFTIPGMDYSFEDFPHSITVDSHSSTIEKKRVTYDPQLTPIQAFNVIHDRSGQAAAFAYARACAEADPAQIELLAIALSQLSPDQGLALLRSRLDQRPILLQWHRMYQTMMQRLHPEQDLFPQYKAMQEKEPGEPTLIYLLGRVAPDHQQARDLFLKAAHANPPVAYAYYALSYDSLCLGRFDEALDLARKAQAIKSDDLGVWQVKARALEAAGRFDQLRSVYRDQSAKYPTDLNLPSGQIYALACQGDIPGATLNIEPLLLGFTAKVPAQQISEAREYYKSIIAYVQGDMKAYAQHLIASNRGDIEHFRAAFATGRFQDAQNTLNQSQAATPFDHLLLYLAAARTNRTADAQRHLATALAQLKSDDPEERTFGKYLSGELPVTPAKAADLRILPDNKCIALCALAAKYPADRAAYLAQARIFNYARHFPHHFLAQYISKD